MLGRPTSGGDANTFEVAVCGHGASLELKQGTHVVDEAEHGARVECGASLR